MKALLIFATILFAIVCKAQKMDASKEIILKTVGKANIDRFVLKIDNSKKNGYSVSVKNNKVNVVASDNVALCRGVYDYLTNASESIVSWSGNNVNIPSVLPLYDTEVKSAYEYHFYFNIVTHGYTTPYWDWERWEKEIEWMALHGFNMPLIPGAHEAILAKVLKNTGFSAEMIKTYFTGPAYFPWNKMGNITGWDGDFPNSYFKKQLELNHKILKKMKALDMHPIVPAFAGFVPAGIEKIYPEEKVRSLAWGGFKREYQANILEPGSDLFIKIGKLYIEEYEKEFGKQEFYLADSFNEMDVPLSEDPKVALEELANYGDAVYKSIKGANEDAVWVMQGWTFPYQPKDGKLFWTPERLEALVSKVPNDKLIILDLANEYNRYWWKSEPSWKMYSGFFGKQWVYSFIPNMGGKNPMNGYLDSYASMPFEALNYEKMGNLIGFGFAPEGIENNEIIYELLSEIGWKDKEINIDDWIAKYCINRYGAYPENMKKAFESFRKSCFGSFTDHPKFAYQSRPENKSNGSVNKSDEFTKGVGLFLSCSAEIKNSKLYEIDAIEYICQYLELKADVLIKQFQNTGEKDYKLLNDAMSILTDVDRLLESHPNWRLKKWTDFARKWGDTETEKNYYESDARRIITTWGGEVNDYSTRTWSGLIRDYYIPRWKLYYEAKQKNESFDVRAWEEKWIMSAGQSEVKAFEKPLEKVKELFEKG